MSTLKSSSPPSNYFIGIDPLRFFQKTARELGVPLFFYYDEFSAQEFKARRPIFFSGTSYKHFHVNRLDSLQFGITFRYTHPLDETQNDLGVPDFLRYLDQSRERRVNFAYGSFDDLGSYASKVDIEFDFYQPPLDGNHRTKKHDRVCYVHVLQPKYNVFNLGPVYYDDTTRTNTRGVMAPYFRDVREHADPGDFRPYIQRMLELYADMPKKEWHDPALYGKPRSRHSSPNPVLDPTVLVTIATLFTGDERETLEKRVHEAQLKLRGSWQSVPRLNLGQTILPAPGQRHIRDDEFVVRGSTYLVEQLTSLGIMKRKEAEKLVARKLEHYLVHRSGFQLSRERARTILTQFEEPQNRVTLE